MYWLLNQSMIFVMASIMQDLHGIETRLDSVITFALIRFVHSILRLFLDETETFLVSTIAVLTITLLLHFLSKQRSASRNMLQLILNILVMVLSQTVINLATQNKRVMRLGDDVFGVLLEGFVATTCLLVLVSLASYAFSSVDAVSRSTSLLLFIYADATEYVISILRLDTVSALSISILVYTVFLVYTSASEINFTLTYLLRGLNMVCINITLRSFIQLDTHYIGIEKQSFVLVLVLFLVDGFSIIVPKLAEARDYAIWKGSQKLFFVIKILDPKPDIILFVCIALLYSKPLWHNLLTAVYELSLLVVLNVVLDLASDYIENAYSVDKAILLFTYVIMIQTLSGLVFLRK
jgi:hypothetical protein